jgi:hypothetical protein
MQKGCVMSLDISNIAETNTKLREQTSALAADVLRYRLRKVISRLEQSTSKIDHGSYTCKFCGGCATHNDGCPVGELWEIINNLCV